MADAFAQGRDAHDAGMPEDANPYDMYSPCEEDDHMSWNDGWASAAEDAEDDDD